MASLIVTALSLRCNSIAHSASALCAYNHSDCAVKQGSGKLRQSPFLISLHPAQDIMVLRLKRTRKFFYHRGCLKYFCHPNPTPDQIFLMRSLFIQVYAQRCPCFLHWSGA